MENGTLVPLESIALGKKFKCPWNDKTFKLISVSPSAAWVEVVEYKEFEARDRKTGGFKTVKQRKVFNEPWSRKAMVEPL